MNKHEWTSVVLCVCLLTAGWPALAQETREAPVSTKQVAVFRLHGPLNEAPQEMEFSFKLEPRRSLYDLLDRLNQAGKDADIEAVLLTFDAPVLGWAQMQEIRQAIVKLKEADKDVYCYLETVDAGLYQLATAASRIVMSPTGDIRLMGLYAEHAYFKGLLDKIGVEVDMEHIGAYKGAGEPFTRTGPSDEAKEMIDWLVQDLYDFMIETIADGRGMKPDRVRQLIDNGPYSASEALEAKLVDKLAYVENFVESLKKEYGEHVTFDRNYGRKKGPEVDFSNIFTLFKTIGKMMGKAHKVTRPSVAVVYVDGMIVPGKTEKDLFGDSGTVGSTTIRRILNKVSREENIGAVVLRVDSPGGSALASDIMWHAVYELNKVKPVVVSMGNVAASGGYYVSAAGSTIFADPGTITGSIGVVGGKIITKGLWDWLGVSFYETQKGKNADLFNTNRRWTDEQRAKMRAYMQEVYGEFKERVTRGRGDSLKGDLEPLAGGRVYTGRQAMEKGLVDKLGGLRDAIAHAAKEARLEKYEVQQFPEAKEFMEIFFKSLSGQTDDEDGDVDITVGSGVSGWTLQSPAIQQWLPLIEAADPQRGRAVLRSLLRIELLGAEHTLLVLPAELLIR